MNHPGWILVIVGVIIAAIGLTGCLRRQFRGLGDCRTTFESEKTKIYIPITTCILLSFLLSGIVWIIRQFFR